MKPNALLLATLLAAAPAAARAEGDNFVDYTCDRAAGHLLVEHFSSESASGKRAAAVKKADRFLPGNLITIDKRNENRIAGVQTVRRTCRLADGAYTFALSGAPNNFNIQGRCGAAISGRV